MSCCCGTKDGQDGRNRNGQAPSKQSMRERGDLNDDERAVDWWRTRQHERGESPVNSFEKSKSRMQQRNPLEKPYAIEMREKPLNPRDGDVLQPSLANIQAALHDNPSRKKVPMEIFEPEVVATTQLPPPQPINSHRVRHAKDAPTSSNADSLTIVRPGGDAKAQAQQSKKQKRKHGSESPPLISDAEDGFSDHLSDVPSDVDSVTKKRYLLACHMLKSTLSEKEKALAPLEREFILSLLEDYEGNNWDDASAISEDQVSAVEQAVLRLENDPLFQVRDSSHLANAPLPSPMTAASYQRRRGANKSTPSKNTIRSILTNPCNPVSPEDAGISNDVVYKNHKASRNNDDEEEDETETEEHIPAASVENSKQIVRYDGWSFHNKSDEGPFAILGADDPKLAPRVLTPSMMEALRGFFPFAVSESNFWLKFSLVREGASLATLLATIRASAYTIIGVETRHGEVFGSFTGTPWRTGSKWFGTGEAFLWRLKKSRYTSPNKAKRSDFENEMEVYPYTGCDDLVQYCTSKTIAVGGGSWIDTPCPFHNEPQGIGFMVDGDLAGGETNSCATFGNPRLCKKASASNEFSIANLEVWTLTPCLTVQEAAKLEVQKLFVEENMR